VVGNIMSKEHERGGLYWGTTWTSAALLATLVGLVAYQAVDVSRHPLRPLPAPVNRRTGEPQRPNGELITVGAS
jgi:hypothetical protein